MDKLQRIIAKLEAKLQPLADENVALRAKTDDLELDNEVALEHIEALESEIAELKTTIASLEELKGLSEEMEAHQREEIALLEAELESQKQAIASARGADFTHSAPSPSPTPALVPSTPLIDSLQHKLRLAQLELEASQTALKAHKRGLLVVLRDELEFDLPWRTYQLALCPAQTTKLEALFDAWRLGNIGKAALSEQLETLFGDCDADLACTPRFDPVLARTYLSTIDPAAKDLSDRAAAQALEDPERIAELVQEPEPELSAPAEPPHIALKLEIALEKAAKAAELARGLEEAKTSLALTQDENSALQTQLTALAAQLTTSRDELAALEAAQVPDLDTISFRQTLATLAESLKLLQAPPQPLVLAPLETAPHSLSAFAGHSLVRSVWDAIDEWEVPATRAAKARQMRILSLIDA